MRWTAPVLLAGTFLAMLLVPATRGVADGLLAENRPVELATFVALLGGAARAWVAVRAGSRAGASAAARVLLLAFGLGLLVTAMEEIAWGQHFLRFATPEALVRLNAQGELTLHNVRQLQGHSEVFRVVFAAGGLAGLCVGRWPSLRPLRPGTVVVPWLVTIAVASGVDLLNDLVPLQRALDAAVNRLSEVVELMIGIAGYLYARDQVRYWASAPRRRALARAA